MRRARLKIPNLSIVDSFIDCADMEFLKDALVAEGLLGSDVSEVEVARFYREDVTASLFSPNRYFDERWYRQTNPDVAAAIAARQCRSGFIHFIEQGVFEGRWPNAVLRTMAHDPAPPPWTNPDFPTDAYLAKNLMARLFLEHFPVIDASQHYNQYGRFLGAVLPSTSSAQVADPAAHFAEVARAFDPDFYRAFYLTKPNVGRFDDDPLSHYLVHGMPAGHSPNKCFDENFYQAFYPEVRGAVERGEIPCGFYHYIVVGRNEARVALFDRKAVLEARVPNVTRPILLERAEEIRVRMRLRDITVCDSASPRIWALLPTINPDITFGGYRSVLELLRRLHEIGWPITIVCTEDGQADKGYFLWREESPSIAKLIREIDVIGYSQGRALEIGRSDTVLAYSLWDLYAARQMLDIAPATRVVLLAQEFEPIFYDNGAPRALVEEAYRIPHYPLINSNFLRSFFEKHRIGVFERASPPVQGRDFAVFEHRINRLPAQTAQDMQARTDRLLVAYARPESHAARNMFEILLLALQLLCEAGVFGPEWTFIGLGALTDLDRVPLGNGHSLTMHPKMSEEEYTRHIKAMDIGVSLMFAPHPSVVPFEFATTGALVVTNVYENRSEAELAAISGNIIPARPSIEGVADALRRAVMRVPDITSRIANIYQPKTSSWGEIFSDTLLNAAFGPLPSRSGEPRNGRNTELLSDT